MDLVEAFKKTVDLLRSNLILFLPPLILAYLIPVALALAGLYIVAPILVAAANSPAPLAVLGPGLVVAIVIIVCLAVIAYAYVLAGWAGMNKNVTLAGKTTLNDFWSGAKAYFARILGAILILAVIYIVLAVVGVVATFAVFLPLFMRLIPTGMTTGAFPAFPSGFPEISRIVGAFGNMFAVWLVMATFAGLVFLFTVFWVQAATIDNVGAFAALGRSISFVRKNFKATLGVAALYIIATGFTAAIFPGGGGGGGGVGGGYGFSLVIPAPLQAIFRLLITTFFVLYMFVVYADKTGKQLPEKAASQPFANFAQRSLE